MKKARVLRENGELLISDCDVTESAWERLCGLLPKEGLAPNQGLWIRPCTSVHTFFMRFSMDAAFLDRSGRVVAIYEAMGPWRHSWIHLTAVSVLETGAGTLSRAGLRKGEVLQLCPSV